MSTPYVSRASRPPTRLSARPTWSCSWATTASLSQSISRWQPTTVIDAGDLAGLNAAILLYKDGKYQEAISYLSDYSANESIIGAGAKSLEGDCYVNLEDYSHALDCFKKAVSLSDDNPAYTPAFMLKEATVLHEMKDYNAEIKVYEEILKEYPNYGMQMGIDIEKYLERAKAMAN